MRYQEWGGLPATLAECPSFVEDRKTDAQLQRMFDTLDDISRDCADCIDFDRIAASLAESKLTGREVNHYNSPLLDGLWKLVSGEDPTDTRGTGMDGLIVDRPQNFSSMFHRLLIPRWYRETLDFLGWWKHVKQAGEWFKRSELDNDNNCFSARRPLICAAGAGNLELVEELLKHNVRRFENQALSQAVRNGHVDVMTLLLASIRQAGLYECFRDSPLLSNRDVVSNLLRRFPDILRILCVAICSRDLVDALYWLIDLDLYQQHPAKLVDLMAGADCAGPACSRILSTDERFGLTGSVTLHWASSTSGTFEDPAWIKAQHVVRASPFFRKMRVVHRDFVWDRVTEGIVQAGADGRFEVMRLLCEGCEFVHPEFLAFMLSQCLLSGVEYNDLSAVAFMISHNALAAYLSNASSNERVLILGVAAATGNEAMVSLLLTAWIGDATELAMLQQLHLQGSRSFVSFLEDRGHADQVHLLSAAVRSGQRAFLEWWFGVVKQDALDFFYAISIAVERTDLSMAELLLAKDPGLFDDRQLDDGEFDEQFHRTIVSIARLGYLTLLRAFFVPSRLVEWSVCVKEMLTEASAAGQLSVVQYMIEQFCLSALQLKPYVLIIVSSVWTAALNGQHAVCLFLAESLCEMSNLDPRLLRKMRRIVEKLRGCCHPDAGMLFVVKSLIELGDVSVDGVVKDWRIASVEPIPDEPPIDDTLRDEVSLRTAAASGQVALVQHFLDCGAVVRYDRSSALQAARKGGHEAVVQLLVSRGADVAFTECVSLDAKPAVPSESTPMNLC